MAQIESSKRTVSANLSNDQLVDMYRQMVRLREFEEKVHGLFVQGLVRGSTHLGVGQEAVAVGAIATLRPDDYILCTYRGHNHVLASGVSAEAALAEILGRTSGLCQGKGGSMHLTSEEHGLLGSYPIVGAHIPIAAGCGWSAQLRGSDQVTLCFFGDGATNIGAFHEGINLANAWELPVIYICENNLYAEYTPIGETTKAENPAADRARSQGMPAEVVDGNDVLGMYDVVSEAVSRARAGEGPTMIEAKTYRHKGHSRTDPAKYRPQEEFEYWMERDPIPNFRRTLIQRGIRSEPQLDSVDEEVTVEIERAAQAAMEAPEPDTDEAYTHVFCEEGVVSWRN